MICPFIGCQCVSLVVDVRCGHWGAPEFALAAGVLETENSEVHRGEVDATGETEPDQE